MEYVIQVNDVSKMFKIYEKPIDRLKELLWFNKKQYHHNFWALKGVSFGIQRGKTVGIIGRNGSGKSTLLQIICGILPPTSGEIIVNGKISSILELGTAFNPEFTGRQNVILYCSLMGLNNTQIEKKMIEIEKFAEIGEFIDQPVKTYSSGMYVRLAFAAAINVEPDIFIVDEALAVGDIAFQRKCYRKFEEFKKQGTTIILVTHDMGAIKQYTDYAILMNNGRVHAIGDPNTIVNQYTNLMAAENNEISVKNRDTETTSEYRYGSGEGEIFEYGFYNKENKKVDIIHSAEKCFIKYKVKFDKDIKQPIYAATIKTKSGLEVYGNNTYYLQKPFESVKKGDVKEVTFTINCLNLGVGDYFISLGVVELRGSTIIPIDRRYDLIKFKILPIDKSFGLTNLGMTIDVKQVRGEDID
ncbi:ABC transporter ATP-binding protein [Thermotalea metallivorans]|uniref:Teichoic acids export ATP-binding protein TagH n=1 Tax=Thermotalea metallivorans TaxID=520762 RepID=A0A140L6W0_9FIRM|nr:ABC transporter ATP-binding protein [Thermotalea metallivorans]KXG76285.1 Teichoic acids export ATP-binding protein TagH [Thermotalea metallivorans]